MIHKVFNFLIIFLLVGTQFNCSSDDKELDNGGGGEKPVEQGLYEWEKNRKKIQSINDLVLIYGGGAHRENHPTCIPLDEEHLSPYVIYKDKNDKLHWLFDGFLFLEIHNGKGKEFATGYTGEPATKAEWIELLEFYFKSDHGIYAIEEAVKNASLKLGKPTSKRKIVIGIPEPKKGQQNWGEVDGRRLIFNTDNDRVNACKWYIDYAREAFDKGNFENIELVGFYWIAEHDADTRSILMNISLYLSKLKYSFNWIPYFNAVGYKNWKELGFHFAYLQPNHFFNKEIQYHRLTDACRMAKEVDMSMEIEFDEKVLVQYGNWSDRLRDYMNAFEENGILERNIAYYQGNACVYNLYISKNKEDQKTFHDFCEFVVKHGKIMESK